MYRDVGELYENKHAQGFYEHMGMKESGFYFESTFVVK